MRVYNEFSSGQAILGTSSTELHWITIQKVSNEIILTQVSIALQLQYCPQNLKMKLIQYLRIRPNWVQQLPETKWSDYYFLLSTSDLAGVVGLCQLTLRTPRTSVVCLVTVRAGCTYVGVSVTILFRRMSKADVDRYRKIVTHFRVRGQLQNPVKDIFLYESKRKLPVNETSFPGYFPAF